MPGQSGTPSFSIKIHPNLQANAIVINYPGYNGGIDGYSKKYEKLARLIKERNIGAVIQMSNGERAGFPYEVSVLAELRATIDYALTHATDICSMANPDIYLVGFSAGGGAVASVAADYSAVKKILLVAPSGDAGEQNIRNGLSSFRGEIYVTVGERDEVVGTRAGEIFIQLATGAERKKLVVVPNCDHQFRGKKNGMILSKAPLWAFCGDETYPSSDGGIVLYE